MYRLIESRLQAWKNSTARKPLILRGVRQCGKTWILKEFGRENFADTVYFSFENNAPLAACFEQDMNPERIIKELGFLMGKTIVPGKTFVIFDEIQFCAKALTSLKYFAEEMPKLHIACAGSYLGIHLAKSSGSFPVGKVDFLTLHPMNFAEFVLAEGGEDIIAELKKISSEEKIPASLTFRLESFYRDYLITGGMPEVVSAWTENHDIGETERILSSITNSYEADFLKYAPPEILPKLTLIWNSIPAQLAKDNHKFIFSHVKTGLKARDLEDALFWLVSAGIIVKVSKVEKPAVPLSMYADASNFKIYLCDTGVLRSLSGFPASGVSSPTPVVADMRGALTENFVLTELLAVDDVIPCFWKRNESEVEFVLQNGLEIIPVEVKAGKNVRARSLAEYRKLYQPKTAIKTSLNTLNVTRDEEGTLL
ncbi:MAG: AAA family ATPase, partial [Methanocorpusculum sp.]|nr:AAA family ATPase [Methanocorpusculum sp.]